MDARCAGACCREQRLTLSVCFSPCRLAVDGSNRSENLLQSSMPEKGGFMDGERMMGTHSKWRASASPAG